LECTFFVSLGLILTDDYYCADRLAYDAGWGHWLSSLKFLTEGWDFLRMWAYGDYCADCLAHGAGWDHWLSSLKFANVGLW